MALASVLVAVFDSHDKVCAALKTLARAGFDMKRLSVVGKDYEIDEHVLGFYDPGDRVKFWGKLVLSGAGCWASCSRRPSWPSRCSATSSFWAPLPA